MKATEIMSTNVQKIKGSATVAQAIKLMRETGVTSLVVERRHEEDAYGIITDTGYSLSSRSLWRRSKKS